MLRISNAKHLRCTSSFVINAEMPYAPSALIEAPNCPNRQRRIVLASIPATADSIRVYYAAAM